MPAYSFVKISNEIYVASPELLFFQLANKYSIEKLFILGMEICGTYCLNKSEISPFTTNLIPLTSTYRIRKYLTNLHRLNNNSRGIKKSISVASYLEDNSASPQESNLYIRLCAPRKYGGYGIKGFELNKKIKLSNQAASILGNKTIRPDLCNTTKKIAIEYDSSTFHDNVMQNTKDKLRLDALHNDG